MVDHSTLTTVLLFVFINAWGLSSSGIRLKRFCKPVTWSEAEASCETEGGRLLILDDFIQAFVGPYIADAKASLNTIWINKTKNEANRNECTLLDRNFADYRPADCNEEHHYVCRISNSGKEDSTLNETVFIPCPFTESTSQAAATTPTDVPSSSATSSGNTDTSAVTSTDKNQSGNGLNLRTTSYIVIGCVVGLIFIIIVVTVVILKKRTKNPGKYAVREESARYHREHGDSCHPTNRSQNDLNEDYDILWKHSNSAQEPQPKEGDPGCASYGHIMPITDMNNSENVYDVTSSNKDVIDKVHDNIYDRTYPPEQTEPSSLQS